MASIVWFRQDLRVQDNPALIHAAKAGNVLPVYILDDDNAQPWAMGGAARAWLYKALQNLNANLDGNLNLFKGKAEEVLPQLVKTSGVEAVCWNRCYEPWRIARDTKIKEKLLAKGIKTNSFNASLLWEPWEISKKDGTPYKVFTPYYTKGCLGAKPPSQAENFTGRISYSAHLKTAINLDELALLPGRLNWHEDMLGGWDVSETGADKQLDIFLQEGLKNYKQGRDFPALSAVSKLSPYLHFGQISPHKVWHTVQQYAQAHGLEGQAEHFMRELGWREFSYHLLYHFPTFPSQNWNSKFDAFPWGTDKSYLTAWKRGETGYPLIDAGMRELWHTGYMHNRVRMVVGSFLVKNLLIDWREGEKWFWDTLVDADLASNSASWQWVAGSGADASPYFRIFNPITQSEKFDAEGAYIKKWVPELANLPAKYIHKPWEAPKDVLIQAGVSLGQTYPRPVVDIKESRERALAAYEIMKN
jgi:deoxyribodipyrimidine photo-lyase